MVELSVLMKIYNNKKIIRMIYIFIRRVFLFFFISTVETKNSNFISLMLSYKLN